MIGEAVAFVNTSAIVDEVPLAVAGVIPVTSALLQAYVVVPDGIAVKEIAVEVPEQMAGGTAVVMEGSGLMVMVTASEADGQEPIPVAVAVSVTDPADRSAVVKL